MKVRNFPVGESNLLTQWPIGNPAVATEISQTVPPGKLWLVRGFSARIVVGGVGARNPTFRFRDPAGNVLFYFATNMGLGIGTHQIHLSSYGYNPAAQLFGGVTYFYFGIPELVLENGSVIDTITGNFNVAGNDQWTVRGQSGGFNIEEFVL